ncbi:MAG TPA: aspartyl protease family protein [Candidatus Acidoferrum sp.]|nr:aspartyl protease family protein [Candidatus Acidoferrum sp.]
MNFLTRLLVATLGFAIVQGLAVAEPAQSSASPASPPVAGAAIAAEPPAPFAEARRLLRTGKFAEAETAYNEILKSEPGSALAYAGLAHVYLKQKRTAEADKAAAKSLELAPTASFSRIAVGEVRFRQGRIGDAETIFTDLVKANAGDARAYYGLGRVYWAASYYQHAKLMFDKANDRDPDDPDVHKRWLFTLTRKERIAALRGYLAGETSDDPEEREHLETSLVTLNEAEEENRRGCHIVSTVKESHQSMEQLMYGAKRIRGYGLKVNIDGAKDKLLLDSGASGILISRKMAEKAGIKSIVKTDVHGIGDKGAVASFIGVADSIKVGDVEFKGCHIEVLDRNSVTDEDGLIGSDVFSSFLVEIDFPNQKFNLTPLPPMPPLSETEKALIAKYPNIARFRDRTIPPELKSYSSIYRFNHMLLIPTRVNDLAPKLFLIDTGAFSDTISPEAAREATKVRADARVQVKGLNGAVKNVYTADDITLMFSHYRQPARDMVSFDTTEISNRVGTEVSGTLGFAMLYQMSLKIDYRDGLVDFGYDPNRWH